MRESIEAPNTTSLSPECILDVDKLKTDPMKYIEINIIRNDRTVDNFFIDASKKKFTYDKKIYNVDSESVLIIPLKNGLIMPTCYFKEKKDKPLIFKDTNKGITGKAMSLLYKEKLYSMLLHSEKGKYNLFIVILSIASLTAYGIGVYLLYTWYQNGGVLP